jgi:hypothetical protein
VDLDVDASVRADLEVISNSLTVLALFLDLVILMTMDSDGAEVATII